MAEREDQVPQEPDDSEQQQADPAQPESAEPAAGNDDLPSEPQAEDASSRDQAEGFELPPLSLGGSSELPDGIALLKDVNLDVKIELGRTRMVVDDVLRLSEGAVVELDKLAGDPVDIYVNGRHIARGEVLVLNENFCVRVSEILEGAEAAAKQIADAAAGAISA
jgi:flagellar motor switch protein FliN